MDKSIWIVAHDGTYTRSQRAHGRGIHEDDKLQGRSILSAIQAKRGKTRGTPRTDIASSSGDIADAQSSGQSSWTYGPGKVQFWGSGAGHDWLEVATSLFEHMFKRRIQVSFDPDLIPVPRKVFKFPRVATEDQYERLLAAVKDQGKCGEISYAVCDKTILMLIHDTGARNGEIISLDIDDLNLEKKSARIKTEKSRGVVPYREIFWSNATNEQLKRWIALREKFITQTELEEPKTLFFGIKAGSGASNYSAKGRRLQVSYVAELFRKYSNRAQLPIINAHSFRHLFGRDLAKKKANNFVISSMMGHARVESSYPYTMLFGKDREDAYRSLRGE